MAEEESEEKEAIPDDEVERLELLLSLPRTGPPSRPKLRSAKSGLGDAFDNVHAYGYLHDLAIRSQQNSRVTIPPVVWLRRQWRLLQDVTAAQLTTQLLRREQLTGLLLDGIVSESKKRGLFKKTSYPDYLQQARFVYSVSRESMCIKTMVENWRMVQRLVQYTEPSSCAHLHERVGKVVGFWGDRATSNSPKRGASNEVVSEEWTEKLTGQLAWAGVDLGRTGESIDQGVDQAEKELEGYYYNFEPPFLPPLKRPTSSRNRQGGGLRNRILKDRVAALVPPELSTEELSEQKPLPVQYHRLPRWARETRDRPLMSSSMAKSQTSLSRPDSMTSLHTTKLPWTASQEMVRSSSTPKLGSSAARLAETFGEFSPTGSRSRRGKLPTLEDRYRSTCRTRRTVPVPSSFVEGGSKKLDGRGMTEAQLLSLLHVLDDGRQVEDLDIESNRLVSDLSLAPLMRKLREPHMRESVRRINFRHCCRVGSATLDMCVELLAVAMNLKHVDMSGLALAVKLQLPLCMGLGSHQSLETVALAGVGLGGSCGAAECVRRLVGSISITSLDLSWNCFDQQEFQQMGKQLVQTRGSKLSKLYLDSTSSVVGASDSSIAELLEALAYNRTLSSLSIAANRIDFKASLVLEDALENHRPMKQLNLAQNPLGSLGLRSLLRLLARESNEIRHFDADGCFTGAPDVEEESVEQRSICQVFSFTNPGGRYKLDLSRPYHRAMLRMLCKTAERYKVPIDKPMLDLSYSLGHFPVPTKHASGVFQVPSTGELSLTFSLDCEIEENMRGIRDENFLGFLEKHFTLTRFHPSWNKVVPLFSKWKDLAGRSLDQEVFLQSIAKDFNMTVAYVKFLIKTAPDMESDVLNAMLPCTPEDGGSRYLLLQSLKNLNNFVSCYKAMECFLLFNAQNPTGHYNLKLHIMSEFAVAQRLLLLDRWECVVNKRNGRLDVSSRANRSHVRNELHGGKQLSLSTFSVAEWSLPEADAFELDYVSSARPPVEAQALTDGLWKQLMVCMYKSDCNPEDKMKVLRSISHSLFITSKHMREMMGYFDKSQQRQEAFVMFFCRIIDMHNLKLCSVRFGEDEEVNNLRYRLGQAVFFPYFQPENAKFELDLGFHDHRLCVNMLVGLAAREKFGNIRDAVWIKPDGSQDDFPMGIPRSWETLSPTEGRFRCRYVCSADDRNFGYRKTIAAKYGYNPRDVREQEMNWLTGLNEPPEDVLDLLEFLISRVDSMQAAFNLIDGGEPGSVSNSELTLRELEQGLKSMGCQKFAGSDESARIEKVFRYLDPGGEGTVSMQEWMVLDQLWKEFDLTIREFVQFLQYAFGENLEDAWEALDDDESGELTEQEFDEALKKKGYFGPVRVVFALLDNTDDGNISFDEFSVLEGYKP